MSIAIAQTLPDSFTWSFPGVPLKIHIPTAVARELERQVDATADAFPSEGGLLLGHTLAAAAVEIDGFRPLPRLDTEIVERAVDHCSGEVVGFYRVTGSGRFSFDERDSVLARSLFATPGSVALLIEAGGDGMDQAAVAFWHDGELIELPARELSRSGSRGAHAEQAPEARRQSPIWSLRRAILLMTLAAAGVFFWSHATPVMGAKSVKPAAREATVAEGSLGFSAERRGPDLLLSWNASSPFIAKAQFGMMVLDQNNVSRQIALAPDQLRAGKMVYTVTAGKIAIELNVVDRDVIRRDSLTIILPEALK
jgi:hypothetical protein